LLGDLLMHMLFHMLYPQSKTKIPFLCRCCNIYYFQYILLFCYFVSETSKNIVKILDAVFFKTQFDLINVRYLTKDNLQNTV
jgi:hypothetical protein